MKQPGGGGGEGEKILKVLGLNGHMLILLRYINNMVWSNSFCFADWFSNFSISMHHLILLFLSVWNEMHSIQWIVFHTESNSAQYFVHKEK